MPKLLIWLILYSSLAFIIISSTKLDEKEDEVLTKIWNKLGIARRKGRRCVKEHKPEIEISVVCRCPNTTCHIIEFSLMGNRLSGRFPTILTKMTTLIDLSIEGNRFSGLIPKEIGNLVNLKRLVISSNDFTGELPPELANLTNLTDVRISDNNITGKLPNFIDQWTKVEKLHIQGCSLEGPIPSSISALTQLVDLRISDLKSGASIFPLLKKMKNLKRLILRNCLIHGEIPAYIGDMKLNTLDLSFNNLSGPIPQSFANLDNAKYIYLAENNLTGSMPEWVWTSTKDVDVSSNHFTWDASRKYQCPDRLTNMVESYSSPENEKNILPCLWKDFPCTKSKKHQIHSLHLNCGGTDDKNINDSIYESDGLSKATTRYYRKNEEHYWALSSTGNFLDDIHDSDVYVISNTSSLHNISTLDTSLYTTARTTAISLTYYGLCLLNGNYNVTLHFAEIIFTEDNSFNSLGKRIFDVYVQGVLMLKDFDIVKEAGGTGRAVIKRYRVDVKNNTLKIQLYWAGKGTTCIPTRGSYGPLISAISVDPNFKPPNLGKKTQLVPILAGSLAGGLLIVLLVIVILWKKGYIMKGKTEDTELTGLDLITRRSYTLRQIKAATNNFDPSTKLGEGGFGCVYKGVLADGTMIAVKKLSTKSAQGVHEFVNEVGMISTLEHPNLVRLYGSCTEHGQMLLVYEYMENNSLSHTLFGSTKSKLTWPVRFELCLGIAQGLVFLHEKYQTLKTAIVHRDIKAANILLDKNCKGKISDFGLAKLNDDQKTHVTTHLAGTRGYMAPEYATRGFLTPKADVFSFGILALEIVSGLSTNTCLDPETYLYLMDQAVILNRQGKLLDLVDRDLESNYSSTQAMTVLNVALLCIESSHRVRPSMSQVFNLLVGKSNVQDFQKEMRASTSDPSSSPVKRRRLARSTSASGGLLRAFSESYEIESDFTDTFITEVPSTT